MKNFIKNNAISVFVSLLALGGLSYADVIVRPYGPTDYAGGAKAVGSKVNAEFQNIVSWLNGGNISSNNISAFGVASSNIADNAVITSKIANNAVTKAKLSGNYTQTGFSGYLSITDTSTTALLVTNNSTTVTTSGRPVLVTFGGSALTFGCPAPIIGSYIGSNGDDDNQGYLQIRRNGSASALFNLQPGYSPCSNYSYVDFPAAGTYTYQASLRVDYTSGGYTASVCSCNMIVQEL